MLRPLLSLLLFAAPTLAPAAAPGGPRLSEIRRDQDGVDNDEFFELEGPAAGDLSAYTYVVIGDSPTGGSGVIEAVIALAGQAVPGSGFFVAAEATFTLGTADLTTTLNFENDESVTHLLVTGFSGADGDDLDTNDDGVLDVTPWASVEDAVGLADDVDDLAYGAALGFVDVSTGAASPPEHVFRDGLTGEWRIGLDALGEDTPGAPNPIVVANEDDGPAARLVLEAPSPNPVHGAAVVAFTLDRPGSAHLALFDVRGRQVAVLASGVFVAARHAVALDVARLAPGAYVVRLEAGGQALTQTLTVVR